MKKNIFIEEMKRRGKEDNNTYSMIGTELKRVRTSQAQTLSSVAGDLCSVSYLCKVEKAQLKPNRYMLNEICKKLNLSSPKLDLLFELKDKLNIAVKLFYLKRDEDLLSLYEECKGLDNYRSKLIALIYLVYNYRLEEAQEIVKELVKITNVMHEDELSIFMVFYSYIKYYEESYNETIDNIRVLSNHSTLEENLAKIASLLCLKCYIKTNSSMTLVHCQKLLDLFLKTSEYNQAEYIRYLQSFYMITNDMLECAYKEYTYISNPIFKNTLEFYFDLKSNTLKKKSAYHSLRPFASLIYTALFERENYLDVFINMDKNLGYDCDFSLNIANYLTLTDDEEKCEEIVDIIIPNIVQTQNQMESRFFLTEFCRICLETGRYKNFCKAYFDLNGGLK